jgi:hypothetical protein
MEKRLEMSAKTMNSVLAKERTRRNLQSVAEGDYSIDHTGNRIVVTLHNDAREESEKIFSLIEDGLQDIVGVDGYTMKTTQKKATIVITEEDEEIEGWSLTNARDGYNYNHEIKVAGKKVQPAAIVYEWGNGSGDFYAEIYFPAARADEYGEPLEFSGEPSHYAEPVSTFEEAMERVKKYVKDHKSADSIRASVNAPKEEN